MAFYPEGIQAQSQRVARNELPWVGGVGSANPDGVVARPTLRWPQPRWG